MVRHMLHIQHLDQGALQGMSLILLVSCQKRKDYTLLCLLTTGSALWQVLAL
jgi:hypothetical protein